MAALVSTLLKQVLDAYASRDLATALAVWNGDEEVDFLVDTIIRILHRWWLNLSVVQNLKFLDHKIDIHLIQIHYPIFDIHLVFVLILLFQIILHRESSLMVCVQYTLGNKLVIPQRPDNHFKCNYLHKPFLQFLKKFNLLSRRITQSITSINWH